MTGALPCAFPASRFVNRHLSRDSKSSFDSETISIPISLNRQGDFPLMSLERKPPCVFTYPFIVALFARFVKGYEGVVMQVTIQDYRAAFIDENLSLTTASIHRSVLETFATQAKDFKLNLTTRNVFDYLMFNVNAKKQSVTFGEVSDVVYADIARYLGKKEETVKHEIVKLVKAALLIRHPIKKRVFIIPSMLEARRQIIAQSKMKKQMRITEAAEKRIAELEAEGMPMTQAIRSRIYAEITHNFATEKKNGNGNGTYAFTETVDLPFS